MSEDRLDSIEARIDRVERGQDHLRDAVSSLTVEVTKLVSQLQTTGLPGRASQCVAHDGKLTALALQQDQLLVEVADLRGQWRIIVGVSSAIGGSVAAIAQTALGCLQ